MKINPFLFAILLVLLTSVAHRTPFTEAHPWLWFGGALTLALLGSVIKFGEDGR